MTRVDTTIRLLGGTLALVVIIVVGTFGWPVIGSVYSNLTAGILLLLLAVGVYWIITESRWVE